jgi:hypothetical protein
MRKLKLQDLEVASFVTNLEPEKARGTVKGNSGASTTYYPPSYDGFCPTAYSCDPGTNNHDSCAPSCFNYTCEGATCRYVIC